MTNTRARNPLTRARVPLRRAAAGLGALLLAGAGLGAATAPAAGARTADAPQAADAAQVWVTTPDRSRALDPGGSVPFDASPQAVDIRIDAGDRGQRFTGAGASVTEASAHLIRELPQGTRDSLMSSLFSTDGDGIGLSYLRQPLGSTDFNAGSFYTYEDTPGQFGIDRDRQEIIPVLRQALAENPELRLMGSPWSAPAWMKTGGSLNGGSLSSDQYRAYARYLVRAVEAYRAEGITLTDLTAQNEPLFPTSYPSMSMTAAEQARFFTVLDEELTAAGLPTNLLAYDHNWDRPDYPLEVFERTAGIDRVIGAAFHCYGGTPDAQDGIRQAGKRVFFTECSGTDSEQPERTFADTLSWHAANLVVGNMRNGGETVINWNLALDAAGGPHQGHCDTRCNGVVEIDGSRITRNAEFYVLGHLTRFVRPGAERIGSTSQGDGGVRNVAFENPDGSRAAFVVNTSGSAQRFSLTDEGRSLVHTLPAGAVATFTWPGGGSGGDGGIDADRWYQVIGTGSGRCLDAADWGTANGTAVQQWSCGTPGQANQSWRFQPTGDGHYRAVNRHADRSWDVTGGSGATGDGTAVQLWEYTGGSNQQWLPEPAGSGEYRFVARHSGKCLTADGTADGGRLAQQPCTGTAAQTFRLSAAD